MRILFGTQNKGKQMDLLRIFSYLSDQYKMRYVPVLPQSIGIFKDVQESGKTFEENSLIKAKYYYELTGLPTIADDGGIMIPALNNEPGVHSKRWMGRDATDEELIEYTLKRLKSFKTEALRKTFFVTCVTYYDGKNILQEQGKIIGHIALKRSKIKVTQGFPFRALFIHPNGKYYDELTQEEHRKYNHRDQAVTQLFDRIVRL